MVSTDSLDLVLSWGGSPHTINMPPASAASPVTSCRRSLRRGTLSAPRSPWHFASAIFCRGTLPRNPGAHTCTRQHAGCNMATPDIIALPSAQGGDEPQGASKRRYAVDGLLVFREGARERIEAALGQWWWAPAPFGDG